MSFVIAIKIAMVCELNNEESTPGEVLA